MTEEEELDDRSYFTAVEEVFVRLRGTPLLLSPADWHVARRWHREGVPLDLVESALSEVFARRKERGVKGRVSSLRYCAPVVEAAWAHLRELTAPAERESAPAAGLDIPGRLQALAAALPETLAERDAWGERIAALGILSGGSQAVEERLAALDGELLDAVRSGLKGATKRAVQEAVERTLAALAGRIPDDELQRSRDRLELQVVRNRLGLPMLSLFSPEAEAGSAAAPA
jgi:hypothetical protein